MVGGGVGFGKSLCRHTNSHVSGNTEGFYTGVHFTWGEGQDTGPRDTWNLHPELFGN